MLSAFSSLSHGGHTFGTEETEQTHDSILKGYDRTTDRMCCNCPHIWDELPSACWCVCSVMVQKLHLKVWGSIAALLCSSGTVVRADLLYCEYTVQLTEWCLPRGPTVQHVFILALVYFAGAGSVCAMQKGKRCSHRSWTWWKVVQCLDTGST